jgi:all-trans-retinol 13,14-reductase
MQYDSIIIGSGLSGLTSALLLARRGQRVLVLEQHAQPAPVVRGFSRDGLYFDSGFHYVGGLGESGPFRPLFRHLGLEEKLELFPYAEQGFDRLRIAETEETYSLPVGFANIKTELGHRFPGAISCLDRYFDEIEKKWSCFPYLDLDTDLADFSQGSVHGESLTTRLHEFSKYPELQSLLSMHSLLYGVDPTEASTTLNTQVAGSYYHSVHGITGGGQALVNALLELLGEAGAEVRCRAEVVDLLTTSRAVAGVRLASGEEIAGRNVVATLNPTLLPGLLPDGAVRPVYLNRLKKLRQTSSAYIFFGKSCRPVESLNNCNLFVQPRAGIFTPGTEQPLEEREFYLTAADRGGAGSSNGVIGIVPASYEELARFDSGEKRRSSAYVREKELIAERLRKMFAANCPELAELELLDLATPLTLRDYSSAPHGAIYGVGRFIGQYNPHPVTRLPGLFLSGQAITAPGLLGTVVAAYLTCGSMLGHDLLRGEIKACR